MKAIDDDLHCYHFYGNNASRFIVPNITNKVKRKRVDLVFRFEFCYEELYLTVNITAPSQTLTNYLEMFFI